MTRRGYVIAGAQISESCVASERPEAMRAGGHDAMALLRGEQVKAPALMNTCYSLIAPGYGISIAAVYSLVGNKIVTVEGAGGLSPVDASDETRAQEAQYAESWYANITADTFA